MASESRPSSAAAQVISLRGVRVHNLKNVDVDVPRGQLVAVCGVSGSGKTSLAIDTLYAEGQRRYIESFSAYTRQFLERLDKPDYDRIDGLPPALAVTRGAAPRGNRSTVGTASEAVDYLRLLVAKIAEPFCYQCGQAVARYSPQVAARLIEELPGDCKLMVGFQSGWGDVTDRAVVLADLQAAGFVRLLYNDELINLGQDERQRLAELLPAEGEVWVIVDRLRGGDAVERSTESLEVAFAHGSGDMALLLEAAFVRRATSQESSQSFAGLLKRVFSEQNFESQSSQPQSSQSQASQGPDGQAWWPWQLSQQLRCSTCSLDYPDPEPQLFNFNSPLGACPNCEGFGDTIDLDLDLVVPDKNKSLRQGALAPWTTPAYSHHLDQLMDISADLGIDVDTPYRKLSAKHARLILDGSPKNGFGGLKGFFKALERKKYKMHVRVYLSRWRSYNTCSECNGTRLNPLALSFRVGEHNFAQLCDMEVQQLLSQLADLELTQQTAEIAVGPLEQIRNRLGYLDEVGLGYLALSRTLRTLSGGEAQRTALTAALGSSLVNMLYVLDEPSVGLHPHDVERLAIAIERLSTRGNTVVMIEHEEALLRRADWLIEVGPAAGSGGGSIVFSGTLEALHQFGSLTGGYLSGRLQIALPAKRRECDNGLLRLSNCSGHNLQGIDVEFPLGMLCLVTGVSGSGKSSLVQDTLYGALVNRLTSQSVKTLPFESISGVGLIDDCILVDQSPISRSPRSNPVTYIKAFDEIRKAFAETVDAKTHNYTASHFSFNSELGRCANCSGDGTLQIDMQFLADVTMTCPDCSGDRYRPEILNVRYRDRNIADVLQMTVAEARQFFRGSQRVQQKLQVLTDVGLDYLRLGQSATTLSSGEGQRLKLAAYLASATRRRTLFILDEPTTGLHTSDIAKLLDCFDALISAGHSLVVVEHNVHLMAVADHIIDLGPGPAASGGRVVASGTPEHIAACSASLTGRYLKDFLASRARCE